MPKKGGGKAMPQDTFDSGTTVMASRQPLLADTATMKPAPKAVDPGAEAGALSLAQLEDSLRHLEAEEEMVVQREVERVRAMFSSRKQPLLAALNTARASLKR